MSIDDDIQIKKYIINRKSLKLQHYQLIYFFEFDNLSKGCEYDQPIWIYDWEIQDLISSQN